FKADIKKDGYHVISLGDETRPRNETGLVTLPPQRLSQAVETTCDVLTAEETPAHLATNFNIGSAHHSFHVMRSFLDRTLDS
ncbi:MAG: hypothetical protein ACE1Z0_08910, partial [Acidimicrobiia bacterium]